MVLGTGYKVWGQDLRSGSGAAHSGLQAGNGEHGIASSWETVLAAGGEG